MIRNYFKITFSIILIFLCPVVAFTQNSGFLKFNGVLLDLQEKAIANKSVIYRVSFLENSSTGAIKYLETHTVNTDNFGLYNLNIGGGTPNIGNFSVLTWNTKNYWLKIDYKISGASTFISLVNKKIQYVPYALHAKTANYINGTIIETDPEFTISLANTISAQDTLSWNNNLYTEIDNSVINEIQNFKVAAHYDSLYISNGNGIKVPGIRAANSLTVTDIDGNVYNTVIIGPQVWMTENLRTSKYANGDPIYNITDSISWANIYNYGAWCWYNNNSDYNIPYGKMYNYFATVDPRHLCPVNWHVATLADFTLLSQMLSDSIAGRKIKSTSGWFDNGNGTNASKLNVYPGGYRTASMGSNPPSAYFAGGPLPNFGYLADGTTLWTSTESDAEEAWKCRFLFQWAFFDIEPRAKQDGYYVRCVLD